MKVIFTLSILTLFRSISFAQINTELIKAKVSENPQDNFYSLLDVFKSDPSRLSKEQVNQLYYGSKFVKLNYTIFNYNHDYDKLWKKAKSNMSKSTAKKIVNEAESKYLTNPLNKGLLEDMTNIYSVLNENKKAELCIRQKDIIIQTIKRSGDGKSEESAICVIAPDEVLHYIDTLMITRPKGSLQQKTRQLPDGSFVTSYKIGDREIAVKLVGGYFYPE